MSDLDLDLALLKLDEAAAEIERLRAALAGAEHDAACRPYVSGTCRDGVTGEIVRMTAIDDELKEARVFVAEARAVEAERQLAAAKEALEALLSEAQDVFNCMADATGIDRHNYPAPYLSARALLRKRIGQ